MYRVEFEFEIISGWCLNREDANILEIMIEMIESNNFTELTEKNSRIYRIFMWKIHEREIFFETFELCGCWGWFLKGFGGDFWRLNGFIGFNGLNVFAKSI